MLRVFVPGPVETAAGGKSIATPSSSRGFSPRWPILSTPEGIESVRRTLVGVAGDKKAELLAVLSRAEANCLVR